MSVVRYATQTDMFKGADAAGHAVYVASDKHEARGEHAKKWFTHFATYADLAQHIEGLPLEQRTFYEIIRQHRPANLYLDIEFLGPAEPTHASLATLLSVLDTRIRAMPCRPGVETLGCEWIDRGASPPDDMLVLKNSELAQLLACGRKPDMDTLRAIPNLALRPRHTIYACGRYWQVVFGRGCLHACLAARGA